MRVFYSMAYLSDPSESPETGYAYCAHVTFYVPPLQI